MVGSLTSVLICCWQSTMANWEATGTKTVTFAPQALFGVWKVSQIHLCISQMMPSRSILLPMASFSQATSWLILNCSDILIPCQETANLIISKRTFILLLGKSQVTPSDRVLASLTRQERETISKFSGWTSWSTLPSNLGSSRSTPIHASSLVVLSSSASSQAWSKTPSE